MGELSDREIMELYRKDRRKGNEAAIKKYNNYIYKSIYQQCPTWLREKEDLYQSGCVGIMTALEGYDADKGKFLTYCSGFVKKELGKQVLIFLGESSEYYAGIHRKVIRSRDRFLAEGRKFTDKEIMKETRLSQKLVRRELGIDYTRVSYEVLAGL